MLESEANGPMIEINLLPEGLRRPEGTPLPRFITTCVGVLIVCVLIVLIIHLKVNVIPQKEDNVDKLTARVVEAEQKASRLEKLQTEIDAIQARVDNVKRLFLSRTIWAKILWDLKQIISLDPNVDRANRKLRYLWLTKLSYEPRRHQVELEGYASAQHPRPALGMLEVLVRNMRTFEAGEKPEKQRRAQLEAMLEDRKKQWETLRQQDETLPTESEEIKKLKERLEELEKRESGMISKQPFYELFKRASVKAEYGWNDAPSPDDALKTAELLPVMAHKFRIQMELKAPGADEAEVVY